MGREMKPFSLIASLLLTLTLTVSMVSAAHAVSNPEQAAVATHAIVGHAPDEDAVKALVGNVTVGVFTPAAAHANSTVSDRILGGFEAGSSGLAIKGGLTIEWGFKFQQGSLQSVAIHDASGRLVLVAIVDDIAHLSGTGVQPVTSIAAYRQLIGPGGQDARPHALVFMRSRSDLATAYPLFKRWLQADLIGFNADCRKTPGVCKLATRIHVPTTTYVAIGSGRTPRPVTAPAAAAASIPLQAFTQ